MNIFNSYPRAKSSFFSWMKNEYNKNESDYRNAPIEEQYRVVSRYLGYPTEFLPYWTEEELYDRVSNYLYLYESSLYDFIYGSVDPLKIINNMEYQQREDKYPDIHTPREILYGINMALVPRAKEYSMTLIFNPSLKDAIIDYFDSKSHAMALAKEQEDLINNSVKNPLKHEDVPF